MQILYMKKKLKMFIKRILKIIDLRIILIDVFRKNPYMSGIYYTFFSSAFHYEHMAVMAGVNQYYKNIKITGEMSVLLRRNIHRLEKGLIMKPRRDVFADSYILETINAYELAIASLSEEELNSNTDIRWAHDVLNEYFSTISKENSIIIGARKKFHKFPQIKKGIPAKPYYRDLNTPAPVKYDDLLDLAKFRRSIRFYEQKPVPRKIVDNAIRIAALSPSACNRQPFEFLIFDDPDIIKEVASIPMGAKGFYHNFPGIVVLIGNISAYFEERDRHVIYIDASLAAMSFIYALETQGISSCVINWPEIPELERKMRKMLELTKDQRVIMLISFGYPDKNGMVPFSQKKAIDSLRKYTS